MPGRRIDAMTQRVQAREFLDRLNANAWQDGPASPDRPNASRKRAAAILQAFGGLHVGETGAGQDLAASDVAFFAHPMPEADDLADEWRAQLGS